jgi:hypothetical protein
MSIQEDGHRVRPTLDSDERQQIQRANQIFLRLKNLLHDREGQMAERDLREAAQGARWLREVVQRYSGVLEVAYKDALAASGLTEEDQDHLRRGTERAGGFSSFVRRDLQRLEGAAPDEEEQPGDPTTDMTRPDLICGTVAGLMAGATLMGNPFYFGFAVGMSRKADCW